MPAVDRRRLVAHLMTRRPAGQRDERLEPRLGRSPPPGPSTARQKVPARLRRAVALAYTYPITAAAAEADIRRVRAEFASPAGEPSARAGRR
jgi:hypothetical protein